MRGSEPGSARRDQRPWEPMKGAPGRGGTTVTFLPLPGARGAGRRLGGPGPAAPRAPSRIWAPGRSCSRLRGGERPGAAPAPRLQPSSRGGRELAGGDAGRGQTAGGERASRLPRVSSRASRRDWAALSHPPRARRRSCPGPADAGASGDCSCALPNHRLGNRGAAAGVPLKPVGTAHLSPRDSARPPGAN